MRIKIDAVGMTYRTRTGPVHAIESVSLDVEDGRFISLVGPSGCGKSTLLKLVAGLLRPATGSIRIEGETVTMPRTDIGMLFQSAILLPWQSVLENVMIQAQLRGVDRHTLRDRALALLEQVGLSGFADSYVFELSGGMQQRVAFCRAVLDRPGALLMDEPFAALDALTREQVGFDLQDMWMSQGGQTVLFVTHSIPEAVLLSDEIAVLSRAPSRVLGVYPVPLPRPRDPAMMNTPEFGELATTIRELITGEHGDARSRWSPR